MGRPDMTRQPDDEERRRRDEAGPPTAEPAESRAAERSVPASETEYRELVENANSIILRLDAQGRVTFLNHFAQSFFGYPREEILGRSVVGTIVPETDSAGRDLAQMIRDVFADPNRYASNENENMRRDGSRVWIAWANQATRDAQGRLTGIVCVGNDITERKRGEEALRISEERLRAISDSALDAVVMMDHEGKVVHWNPAAERMFGYRPEEILGRRVHEVLVPARYAEQAAKGMRRFLRSGHGPVIGKVLELQALRKDGSEFPVELAVSAIPSAEQWAALAIVRDITERSRAQDALRMERGMLLQALDLHERDRQLVAFEIHDGFTQDVTGAVLQFDAFRTTLGSDPTSAWNSFETGCRLLRQSMAEARRLINGLRPPTLAEYGLVPALEQLITEANEPGGPEVRFSHQVQFDRLPSPVEGAIFRIVQECLTNARRYSKSPRIEIRLQQDEGRVRVEVQDWGVGFDPQQVASGHFGLEGIRQRALLLDGQASVESTPGQGTRVTVDVPLLEKVEGRRTKD